MEFFLFLVVFFGLHRDLLRCCATKTSSKRGGEWLHHKFINILYLCCASILNFKVMRSGDNQHRICIISHNGIEKDFFFTTFSTTIQHQFSISGRFVTACRQWKTFVVTETAHVSQQNHNEGHFSTKKTEKTSRRRLINDEHSPSSWLIWNAFSSSPLRQH